MRTILIAIAAIITCCFTNCQSPQPTDAAKSISEQVQETQTAQINHAWDSIHAVAKLIQNGDLICRTGIDFSSQSLQMMSTQDKSFSHGGLAFIENGQVMIYHSIASATDTATDNFRKEPLDSFVNPKLQSALGIYRYKLSTEEINCMCNTFQDMERRHVPFDKYFNLADDDKLYCSEAIAKALKKCTHNRVLIPITVKKNFKTKNVNYNHLNGKVLEYISIDNLYLNPFCDPVKRINYNITR